MGTPSGRKVFVTGVTGYVGGRLVPRLLDSGYGVRCHARSPEKLEDRIWVGDPGVELVRGDLAQTDVDTLAQFTDALAEHRCPGPGQPGVVVASPVTGVDAHPTKVAVALLADTRDGVLTLERWFRERLER